jgi:isochorismate synthase
MIDLIDREKLIIHLQQGVERAKRLQRPILVSVTQQIAKFNVIELFSAFRTLDECAFFWSQPEEHFSMAGLGAAFMIETAGSQRFSETAATWTVLLKQAVIVDPQLSIVSGPVLMGGFAYDTERPAMGIWQDFAEGSFALSRLQLTSAEEQHCLTINVVVNANLDAKTETDNLIALWELANSSCKVKPEIHFPADRIMTEDVLPATEWKQIVRDAIAVIASGAFEKTVLARMIKITNSRPFDLKLALQRLCEFYPRAYVFAVQRKSQCFLGATPERLVKLVDKLLRTTVLTGANRRGTGRLEDVLLGEQLLHNEKDMHEHKLGIQLIQNTLTPLCNDLDIPEQPQLLRLKNVQHLYTPIIGRLKAAKTMLDIAELLHPTPVVSGLARSSAQAYIRAHEKLDRGWYAGPLGWINRQGDGELALGICSAIMTDGQTGFLFADSGITADSNPEIEYQDTVLKLGAMLLALGGPDKRKAQIQTSQLIGFDRRKQTKAG